jgi:hypothetical protein
MKNNHLTITKPFLYPSDVEKIFGISKEKLAKMRNKQNQKLKHYELPNRLFVYYPDDVKAYINN